MTSEGPSVNWQDLEQQMAAFIDDETETDIPVPVDPPPLPAPQVVGSTAGRQPILPAWLRSGTELRAAVRWVFGHLAHVSVYHLIRVPKYAARLLWQAPQGIWRLAAWWGRWVSDAEGRLMRVSSVHRDEAEHYLKLSRQRDARVRWRALVSTAAILASLPIAAALVWAAKVWQLWLSTALAVLVFGIAGRPVGQPLLDTAVVKPRVRRLSIDVVQRAFLAAGLCKPDDLITLPAPIAREGNGWRAIIDLPYGTTADKAIKKRAELAAGLDLDEVQVWPQRVRGTTGSARRLSLWVADADPYAEPSGPWPLLRKGGVDVFAPFPFGVDQRGHTIPLQLMFTGLVIGSIPRIGKTFAARLPALAAALDPTVQLHVYNGKGPVDWVMFDKVAHRCGWGVRDDTVEALLADLRELVVDMNRRYDTLGSLPADVCPEGKVTRDIADKRSLGLWPILVAVDEFQRYSQHPLYGQDIVAALTDLAKVGPAVGIMLVLATQKPDGKSIPTDLRDNLGTRFALKTMTWQSSEAVLGSGSYTAGHDASRFQRAHKGVGILLGADDSGSVEEAVTVRTFLAATADAEHVIDRARQYRETAGLLTGHAAGQPSTATLSSPQVDSLLDDLATVFPPSQEKVWSETLLQRLADYQPDRYQGWTTEQLALALQRHRIDTIQIGRRTDGKTVNRRGVNRADLTAAITDRDRNRRPG